MVMLKEFVPTMLQFHFVQTKVTRPISHRSWEISQILLDTVGYCWILLDTVGEDTNENGVLDAGEDINGNGQLDKDSGIFSIELLPNANNLRLEYDLNEGDLFSICFRFVFDLFSVVRADRIDESMPANGEIKATDRSGKTCMFNVTLEPFDRALFDEIFAFPREVYKTLFGLESELEMPLYTINGFSESVGIYTNAATFEGYDFSVEVTEIMTASSNYTDNKNEQQEEMEGFSPFTFHGVLSSSEGVAEVIAVAYTYDEIHPEYNFFVILDPQASIRTKKASSGASSPSRRRRRNLLDAPNDYSTHDDSITSNHDTSSHNTPPRSLASTITSTFKKYRLNAFERETSEACEVFQGSIHKVSRMLTKIIFFKSTRDMP